MKVDFWIKVPIRKCRYGPKGQYEAAGVPQASKNKPSLHQSEFAFKVTLEVPDAYFAEPELNIAVKMPEVCSEPRLNVDLAENIGEIIKQQVGVNAHVSLSAEEPEDE